MGAARWLLAALLGLGVVAGYGSGVAHLVYGDFGRGGCPHDDRGEHGWHRDRGERSSEE